MRRSLHFVPGGQERMRANGPQHPARDGLILDLRGQRWPPSLSPPLAIVRRLLETLDFSAVASGGCA